MENITMLIFACLRRISNDKIYGNALRCGESACSSWAAFPVNCRCAAKALLSRSSILLKDWLNYLNSGSTSSFIFISAKLFSCTCSTCEVKLRRGLRARPLTK
jgi:hypothetical protein